MAARKPGKETAALRAERTRSNPAKHVERVRALALSLPETVERSVHGTPGFYVGNKLFAWIREDLSSVAVWVDLSVREGMLSSRPDVFVVTPHYEEHPMVLVRFAAAERALLERVLAASWRIRAPKSILARREK